MVGPSKILTVSYGTFSCTLEGFDDSFATMKAIAEYFRDLAADDRYFGAEPATPDADMLARIAEREVARRVEARMDASGITLRTGTALERPVAEPATPDADTSSPVSLGGTAPTMPPAARPVARTSLTNPDETADSNTSPSTTVDDAGFATGDGTWADHVDPAPTLAAPAPVATNKMSMGSANTPPDSESVAAKLQRIRAVVGKGSANIVDDENAFAAMTDRLDDNADNQALHDAVNDAEAADGETDENLSAMMARLSQPADEGDNSEDFDWSDTDSDADEPEAGPDRDDDAGATVDDSDDAGAEGTPDMAAASEAVDDDQSADVPHVRARVIRMKRSDYDRAVAKGRADAASDADVETNDDDPIGPAEAETGSTEAETAEVGATETDVAESDEGKIDPAESEMADQPSDDDEMAEDLDDLSKIDGHKTADELVDNALSDEKEAELLAELAMLQREDQAEPGDLAAFVDALDNVQEDDQEENQDAPSGGADVEVGHHDPRLGREILEQEPDADEESMSRILSQTDAELLEPEGNRRRQAIAQLRAAVAATEAARRMGEPASDKKDAEIAFRDDLEQVVRPRRATLTDTSERSDSERPRPAPLKLVASQRIDTPKLDAEPAEISQVQPRRVHVETTNRDDDVDDDLGSFADYAESVGAKDLGELLEAAAAYTSFVEGLDDFSRPQIMKKVRMLSPEEFNREDGLRSFGTLLRQGRINKIRNGRFRVSEQTRFRPEALVARG